MQINYIVVAVVVVVVVTYKICLFIKYALVVFPQVKCFNYQHSFLLCEAQANLAEGAE